MPIAARYAHTNLVARDWRSLAQFYEDLFGCVRVAPEIDAIGPLLEAGSGIPGARLRGVHLRLPGYGDAGPTLEIFAYEPSLTSPPPAVNRSGYGHIAFAVLDVAEACEAVLSAGGSMVGDVVTLTTGDGRRVTWCYVTDPESNIIELQAWAATAIDADG